MTEPAIDPEPGKADRHDRGTDRVVVPVLVDEADGAVAVGADLVGKDARENDPHAIANAVRRLDAHRPVCEMLLDRGVVARHLAEQVIPAGDHDADREETDTSDQPFATRHRRLLQVRYAGMGSSSRKIFMSRTSSMMP